MARLITCSRPGRRFFEAILPSSLETEVEVGMFCVAGIQGRAELCRVHAIGEETASESAAAEDVAEDAEEDAEDQTRPARIFRIATAEDLEREERNRALAEDAMRLFDEEVAGAPQGVQVVTAWFSLDRSRLILLYRANRRFPARKAGAVLAKRYRTSVRVFQIGVRDAAAVLGGLGTCGRQFCCAPWQQGIQPVSLRMAKAQDHSLTPASVDGTCGRLKCCLRYEYDQPQNTDGTEDTDLPEDTETDGTATGTEPQDTDADGTDTCTEPQDTDADGTDASPPPQAAAEAIGEAPGSDTDASVAPASVASVSVASASGQPRPPHPPHPPQPGGTAAEKESAP